MPGDDTGDPSSLPSRLQDYGLREALPHRGWPILQPAFLSGQVCFSDSRITSTAALLVLQHRENFGKQRPQRLDAVRPSPNGDHREGSWQLLGTLDVLVYGQNRGKRPRGSSQELAVLNPGPPLLLDGAYLVANKFINKLVRQALIEQNAHWLRGPRVLTRAPPPPAHGLQWGKRLGIDRGCPRLQGSR